MPGGGFWIGSSLAITGTTVGAGGGGPAPDFLFMDKFTRADTANGTLGTPLSDGLGVPAFAGQWAFNGGDTPVTGKILSNRYTSDPAAAPVSGQPNNYATQTIPSGKIRKVEAILDWRGSIGAGVPPASTATIIIAPTLSSPVWSDGAVHLQINPYAIFLDYLSTGGVVNNIVPQTPYNSFTPVTPLHPLTVLAQFDDAGNYNIRCSSADFTPALVVSGNDANLASRLGPVFLAQCYQTNPNHAVQWLQVKVGTKALGAP